MKKYSTLLLDQEPLYRIESVNVNGNNRPQDLYDVMYYVADSITKSPRFGSLKEGFLSHDSLIISWSPSLHTLFLSLLGRNVFYLCWGVPCHASSIVGRLKGYKLKLLLRNAKYVFVNDKETQSDVLKMTGIVPARVHYVVDNVFFRYAPYIGRKDYILVPGNNDRDENLVVELSRKGYQVVRLTRASCVKDLYVSKLKSSMIDVRFNVSVEEVRSLYQNAKVVALPISSNNHAAGQTAILEAISCGAPVVLSSGRTSSIVSDIDSVALCQTNSCEEWVYAIERALLIENKKPGTLKKCSDLVKSRHSPSSVATSIINKIKHYND